MTKNKIYMKCEWEDYCDGTCGRPAEYLAGIVSKQPLCKEHRAIKEIMDNGCWYGVIFGLIIGAVVASIAYAFALVN